MVSSHLAQVSEVPCALHVCVCACFCAVVSRVGLCRHHSHTEQLYSQAAFFTAIATSTPWSLTCVTCCTLYICHFTHAAEIASHHVWPFGAASSFRMLPGDPRLTMRLALLGAPCCVLLYSVFALWRHYWRTPVCSDLTQLALGVGLLAHAACHILSLALSSGSGQSKARCTDLLVRSLSGDWQLWLPQGVSCEQLCCVNSGVIPWGRCLEVWLLACAIVPFFNDPLPCAPEWLFLSHSRQQCARPGFSTSALNVTASFYCSQWYTRDDVPL